MSSTLVANVRRLMVGNGLAQVLQFASILVLSRIYAPEEFGVLAQVQSLGTAAAILATLQMHLVVPLCRDGEEAARAASAAQTTSLAFLLVVAPAALWFGAVPALAVLLASILGLSNTYGGVLVFRGDFATLSRFYVIRAIVVISMQILFALLSIRYGLVLAAVAGEALAAAYLRLSQVRTGIAPPPRPAALLALLSAWKSFAVFGTAQELISVAAFYAPLLGFSWTLGDAIAGQYAMANRLVWGPVILVSGSLAQALYHHYATVNREGGALSLGRFAIKILAAGAAASALSFLAQPLFLMALGGPWLLASELMPLQVCWGSIFLASIPYRVACRVMQLQRYQGAIDLAVLVVLASMFSVTALAPLTIVGFLVGLACIQNGMLAFVVHRAARSPAS